MPPFGYLRKSRVVDLSASVAPETQERAIRDLAVRSGEDVDALVLLSDWDISGDAKHTRKRAGYQELLGAIESGVATSVYSYSLSRLGRSVVELNRLFALCRDRDVPIRLVADSLDTSTASGRLTAHILASLAEFESDVAGERRRAQIQSKRARGESLRSRRYYGESDGEDAELVLRLYRETGSYSRTAERLNAVGVRARSGKKWYATSVRIVVQRLDPTVRSEGRGRKARVAFAFARLLKCPTCGVLLTGSTSKGQARYVCSNYADRPHPRVSVSERLVRPWIESEAARLQAPNELEGDVDLDARQAELAAERDLLVILFSKQKIDEPTFDRLVVPIQDEMATLNGGNAVQVVPESVDWSWPVPELNAVLRALWDHVDLDADLRPVAAEWRRPEWRS